MRRYTVRPRACGEEYEVSGEAPTITVYEREPREVKTGLLDARGHPIVAVEEMEPIGFLPISEH